MNTELVDRVQRLADEARVRQFYNLTDDQTRGVVSQELDERLHSMKALRQLVDYKVVCDRTNNPPVREGELVVDVWITDLSGRTHRMRSPS